MHLLHVFKRTVVIQKVTHLYNGSSQEFLVFLVLTKKCSKLLEKVKLNGSSQLSPPILLRKNYSTPPPPPQKKITLTKI